MKTALLLALVLGAALVALAPAAEAKLACSELTDPTCDALVCVWNPARQRFECTADWTPPPWP